jgi:hypothetical protein
MATGRLGTANITLASTNTTIYGPVASSTFSVVSVNICNRNSTTAATIRVAVATSATPGLDEWIEYDTSLVASGVVERTGLVMKTGDYLVVQVSSATPTVSVVAFGIETSTA